MVILTPEHEELDTARLMKGVKYLFRRVRAGRRGREEGGVRGEGVRMH